MITYRLLTVIKHQPGRHNQLRHGRRQAFNPNTLSAIEAKIQALVDAEPTLDTTKLPATTLASIREQTRNLIGGPLSSTLQVARYVDAAGTEYLTYPSGCLQDNHPNAPTSLTQFRVLINGQTGAAHIVPVTPAFMRAEQHVRLSQLNQLAESVTNALVKPPAGVNLRNAAKLFSLILDGDIAPERLEYLFHIGAIRSTDFANASDAFTLYTGCKPADQHVLRAVLSNALTVPSVDTLADVLAAYHTFGSAFVTPQAFVNDAGNLIRRESYSSLPLPTPNKFKQALAWVAAGGDPALVAVGGFALAAELDLNHTIPKITRNVVIESTLSPRNAVAFYKGGSLREIAGLQCLRDNAMAYAFLKYMHSNADRTNQPILWYLENLTKTSPNDVKELQKLVSTLDYNDTEDIAYNRLGRSWLLTQWVGKKASSLLTTRTAYAHGEPYTFKYASRLDELTDEDLVRGDNTPVPVAFAYAAARRKQEVLNTPYVEYAAAVPGNRSITQITNSHALINEGDDMQHCVGGEDYLIACEEGTSAIYHIHVGEHNSTFEITKNKDMYRDNKWRVAQHYGPADSEPAEVLTQELDKWAKQFGVVRQARWTN